MTTRTLQPIHPCERGSIAIEFALSVIILAMLIFGCIGVAMAFYTYEVVNEYARDASRLAIVRGNGCIIQSGDNAGASCSIGTGGGPSAPASMKLQAYLNNEIFPGINGNNLQITTTYAPAPGAPPCSPCNSAGNQVTVDVAYRYLYNIPFVPSNTFTMHGTSTMVISQ
jgi:Flp pilus assembly protein TadG